MREKTYNKKIYKYAVLSRAINDYCRLADIQIEDCGDEWKCVFSSETVPLDILVSEFDNYLIELSQIHINV